MSSELTNDLFPEFAIVLQSLVWTETATWTVGLNDRKRLSSGGSADLAAWSGSVQTKYGDYVIVGNMVLLCEGTDSDAALSRCSAFVDAIP